MWLPEFDADPLFAELHRHVNAGHLPAGLNMSGVATWARVYIARCAEAREGGNLKPSEAMARIDAIVGRADRLWSDVQALPDEIGGAVAEVRAINHWTGDPVSELLNAIQRFTAAMTLAGRRIESASANGRQGGAPPSLAVWLGVVLAGLIEDAGGAVNATRNGALVVLLDATLRAAGSPHAKPEEIARKVVRERCAAKPM